MADDLPPWASAAPAEATTNILAPAPARPVASEQDEALAAQYAQADTDYPSPPVAVAAVPVQPRQPAPAPAPSTPAAGQLRDGEDWLTFVASSSLSGPARELAANSAFNGHADGVLRLSLTDGFDYLQTDRSLQQLEQALCDHLGYSPRIVFGSGQAQAETLHARQDRQRGERQSAAQAAFMDNPDVRQLVDQQGARVVPDSIRPYQE